MGECAETIHNLEHEPCEPISKEFCFDFDPDNDWYEWTRLGNTPSTGCRLMKLVRVSKKFSWQESIKSPNG